MLQEMNEVGIMIPEQILQPYSLQTCDPLAAKLHRLTWQGD